MREDRYTNTPEDAAAWARDFSDEDPSIDPREVLDGHELYEYLHHERSRSSSRMMRRVNRERYGF